MRRLRITVEEKCYEVEIEALDEDGDPPVRSVISAKGVQSSASTTLPVTDSKKPAPSAPPGNGTILSPLSAVVVSVDVAVGDPVETRQKVITLEAMKMNTTVPAPSAGKVEAIYVSVGDAVEEGQPLIKLD